MARSPCGGRAALHPGRTGQRLVVTELPYGVMKGGDGGLILQTADGVRQRSLKAIVDLYDDSSQEHGMGLVLDLAPNTALTGSSILFRAHRSSNQLRGPADVARRGPATHGQSA
jgi:DNA gyrase/topoisomerase IV subunit A